MNRKGILIEVDGKVIVRKPRAITCGNFCQLIVRYKNDEYFIGDGDEYIRGGYSQLFKLEKERKIVKCTQA